MSRPCLKTEPNQLEQNSYEISPPYTNIHVFQKHRFHTASRGEHFTAAVPPGVPPSVAVVITIRAIGGRLSGGRRWPSSRAKGGGGAVRAPPGGVLEQRRLGTRSSLHSRAPPRSPEGGTTANPPSPCVATHVHRLATLAKRSSAAAHEVPSYPLAGDCTPRSTEANPAVAALRIGVGAQTHPAAAADMHHRT